MTIKNKNNLVKNILIDSVVFDRILVVLADSNLKITHNSCLNIYYDNFRKLFRPFVQRLTTLFHLPDRMC